MFICNSLSPKTHIELGFDRWIIVLGSMAFMAGLTVAAAGPFNLDSAWLLWGLASLGLLAALATLTAMAMRVLLPGRKIRSWIGYALAVIGVSILVGEALPAFFNWAVLALAGVTLLVANSSVSYRVQRDRYVESAHRRRQLAFIWLVPVVGAAIVSAWYGTEDYPSGDHCVYPEG